ncbi:sugar transferase [Oribacterium sp. oral taxon 108]|uniref:sugar transferase n=1 Tax=Oribacterium sp. oral taxon 108 TaxID=712414 RepID=UPI00020DD9CC|nr:sugar transferase [Oribacterium sp. oral taxon 108]EGL36512.1 bacterial sugar transferase [Oribacterium sp. oral taxon 108 str. F0425]
MKILVRLSKLILCVSIFAAAISLILEALERKKTKRQKRQGIYERYLKRPFDCFFASFSLLLFSPLMLFLSLLVRAFLGAPVLFTQDRPGRDGKIFKLYKFRTMTDKRDKEGNLLADAERLTPFGKMLRSSSLDELPELLNIIRGEMSFIGPRPLLVKYLPLYNEVQARRHDVRPGLTGLAQSRGRNSLSWEEKFKLDVEYVNHITFLGDLKIIVDTIRSVLNSEGISADGDVTMPFFTGNE